jgi:hypothetical protein
VGGNNGKRKEKVEGKRREGKNACIYIHIHIQESVESGRSYKKKIDNQEEER